LGEATDAVAQAFQTVFGNGELIGATRAILFSAKKPPV
jgi:hypothetical protein